MPTSYIYLIEAENGLVKIGRAQKVTDRVASVRLHSPVRTRLIATWIGGHDEEEALHEHFRAFRRHGEWFVVEGGFAAYVDGRRGLNISHIPSWDDLAFNQRGTFRKQRCALARESGAALDISGPARKRAPSEPLKGRVGLTPRMNTLLRFLGWYLDEHGCTPSFQEMADELGLASKSGIHRLVTSLLERGYVEALAGRHRTLALTDIGKAHLRVRSYVPPFKTRPYGSTPQPEAMAS